jgi:hypothetical protein
MVWYDKYCRITHYNQVTHQGEFFMKCNCENRKPYVFIQEGLILFPLHHCYMTQCKQHEYYYLYRLVIRNQVITCPKRVETNICCILSLIFHHILSLDIIRDIVENYL